MQELSFIIRNKMPATYHSIAAFGSIWYESGILSVQAIVENCRIAGIRSDGRWCESEVIQVVEENFRNSIAL